MGAVMRHHQLRHNGATIDGTAQRVLDYAMEHRLAIEFMELKRTAEATELVTWTALP